MHNPRITCTLSAEDWSIIVNHWDFYAAHAKPHAQDSAWREDMTRLTRYVKGQIAAGRDPIDVSGPWLGFCHATQWGDCFAMGTASDLRWVMARLAPQVSIQEPAHGVYSEAE